MTEILIQFNMKYIYFTSLERQGLAISQNLFPFWFLGTTPIPAPNVRVSKRSYGQHSLPSIEPVTLWLRGWPLTSKQPSPCGSVASVQDLRIKGPWFDSQFGQILRRTYDSQCDRIHPSLTEVHVSTIVIWETSKWLGKNIVRSKKNSMKLWISSPAAAI